MSEEQPEVTAVAPPHEAPPRGPRWLRAVVGTIQTLAVLVFATIVTITFLNIARRFLGLTSYLWVEETARVLLLWLTFLGGTLAVARGTHLTLDLFTRRTTGPAARIGRAVTVLGSILFFGLLVRGGWDFAAASARRLLPSLEIPAIWQTASAAAGGALFLLVFLGQLLSQQRRDSDGPATGAPTDRSA